MKKLAIIGVLTIGLCKAAESQILIAVLFGDKLNSGKLEFGMTVNPAWTNITGIESKWKSGLNLGIYFNIWADKKFFLHAEGIAKGAFGARKIHPYPIGNDTLDALFAGGSVLRKIKGFSLPVLGRYAISQKFFAEAGIQVNLRLGAKDIFEVDLNDNELDYTKKVSKEFTRIDFGAAAGLFYKFNKGKRSMGIGVRYFRGVTDIYKTMPGTQSNTSWQLLVTIPIGAPANPAKNKQ